MTAEYEEIRAHQHAIQQVIPLLEAIRAVAEIAFRHADERLPPLTRYASRIEDQLAEMGPLSDLPFGDYANLPSRSLLVMISSERGLCGAFNRRLVEGVRAELEQQRSAGEEAVLVCLGRRGQRLMEAAGERIFRWSRLPSFALPDYLEIEKEAVDILDLMEEQGCSRLIVMHNVPERRFSYQVARRQLLPVEDERLSQRGSRPVAQIKPAWDAEELLTQMITERVLIDIYHAVVESAVSEELARVAAMRLAVENARHLLEDLTLEANRTLQISETNALLEIIGGFEVTSSR
jgi:F-type H+-transporting ATPase subunit gamma